MEVIDIIFEEDRSKEVYNRYFKFERQRELKKVPIWLIIGICSTMVIVGILFKVDILWILGLISIAFTAVYLLLFLLRFQIVINKFWKEFEKKTKTTDKEFQFSFNSDVIKYNSENLNTEIKWPMIKSYIVNDKDIYLYIENRELFDIISEDILGQDKFAIFKTILEKKVKNP